MDLHLTAKFTLKLKKAGETTGLLKYDLNQIPYDYTVKVTNRFKGLDLVDRVPEKLQMEVGNIVHETVTKIILIMFFAANDEEALYSQQKQDLELIVAQIMSFLLQNSGLS